MKPQILFVDDEERVLAGLKRMLRDHLDEWDMTFANGPAEAEQYLAAQPFDTACLDVTMPIKSGIDLLREIKTNPQTRHIEVIILTGLQDAYLKSQALDLGAADLLNKPTLKEDLIARLRNVIRLKGYRDSLIAKNRELEAQLIESQKMEVVGVLAAGVVHDIKNIMTIIIGYPELIALKIQKQQSVERELRKIQDAAERAHRMMMQLLKMTRKGVDERIRGSLVAMIDDSLELFRMILPRSVTVNWARPDDQIEIDYNEIQINQVLLNLLINAGQAITDKGQIDIALVEVAADAIPAPEDSAANPSGYLKLTVTDNGKGMDTQTMQRIFDPSFTTKAKQGGFGLGLMVVKWIVENHRGAITVDSQVGIGTTFSVYLPKP